MKPTTIALVIVIVVTLVGVAGDYLFKRASETTSPFLTKWFVIGLAIYCANAFAWVMAMQKAKLAFIGAVYCVVTILFLTAIGYFLFDEKLNTGEAVGVIMAVGSVILLVRFA